jgi:hypothetical protein
MLLNPIHELRQTISIGNGKCPILSGVEKELGAGVMVNPRRQGTHVDLFGDQMEPWIGE